MKHLYRFNKVSRACGLLVENLNTTHVSVQYPISTPFNFTFALFKYNSCIGSILFRSQNHYLRVVFKYNSCIGSIERGLEYMIKIFIFKYNSCIGSIHQPFIHQVQSPHLNTTHVSVQCNNSIADSALVCI